MVILILLVEVLSDGGDLAALEVGELDARQRSMRLATKPRSRHIEQEREEVRVAATCSSEKIDKVNSVNGTPNASAAWAARISSSACCMPVRPDGASATGIVPGWPSAVQKDRLEAVRAGLQRHTVNSVVSCRTRIGPSVAWTRRAEAAKCPARILSSLTFSFAKNR